MLIQQDSMKNEWILDLGVLFHMTVYGYWFHTYQSCNGTIYMGENSLHRTMGVREIQITMFDDSIVMIIGVQYQI